MVPRRLNRSPGAVTRSRDSAGVSELRVETVEVDRTARDDPQRLQRLVQSGTQTVTSLRLETGRWRDVEFPVVG